MNSELSLRSYVYHSHVFNYYTVVPEIELV